MFGFRFIKTQPTEFVIQYKNGRPVREGPGLAFWYFSPSTAIVVVPTASVNEPFIFPEATSDFQEVTVQGQIIYRIAEPRRTAELLNFTVGPKGAYVSEDPQKLSQRLIDQVQVAMRAEVQALPLKEILVSDEGLVGRVLAQLKAQPMVTALGLEILGLSLLAVKPKPETAKALEAEAREALLQARRRGDLFAPQRGGRAGADDQGERARHRDRGREQEAPGARGADGGRARGAGAARCRSSAKR